MAGITLHKVIVKEYNAMLYAMYAEDPELISTFHQNAGQGLDVCVATTLAQISAGSTFYKIETDDGTLMGYFVVALPIDGAYVMEGFFIRKKFRTKVYQDAFIALINSTFSNDFFTSTGVNNYRAISFLLKYNFQITNPSFDFNGKSFVILKASNS